MKFLAVVAALSSFAAAGTVGERSAYECTPGTYQCLDQSGWQVCDVSGKWVFAGNCPPKTVCRFYEPSKSPYCIPHDPGYSH
ncbi:hypothetical protein HRG_000206 [Hirsutella rhossiliensis]|uniref:Uncharacterized protein n=1 Tax=Hirsutella rhossiliensis TaxID=111463 RepID=A0A9P8SMR0_9HYPO|nr:uncharacterized protein HRG_00206 [Hirsutella rhossiliensis]KAH0967564.1 hypothetical protein HRG_00206 [Hirsutella rhossiliensis]